MNNDLISRSATVEIMRAKANMAVCTDAQIVFENAACTIEKIPAVGAVPHDEYDSLLRRFRHLLESDYIQSFDQVDPRTGAYKRDIAEANAAADQIKRLSAELETTKRERDAASKIIYDAITYLEELGSPRYALMQLKKWNAPPKFEYIERLENKISKLAEKVAQLEAAAGADEIGNTIQHNRHNMT